MSSLVLIIDDEQDLLETLKYAFTSEGFRTDTAADGNAGLARASRCPYPDVIVLDVMLPDISGVELCRRLRANSETTSIPIIMVTAKDAEVDRVVGFEVGADDYVVKPFSVRELILRVRAITRRRDTRAPDVRDKRVGELRVDTEAHRVWVEGEEVVLTYLEFRLLKTFMSTRGRVQTRENLLQAVWGLKPDLSTRTVDTHVQRLRKKLGSAGSYIETLRGLGYRLRDVAQQAS